MTASDASDASYCVAAAREALDEAAKRIPTPAKWDYCNPAQLADLERGRLAQTRAITNAILAATAELRAYNLNAALTTGVLRRGTPAAGAAFTEILEHLGITTTAKES